jgi:hypothetical protein
MEKKKKKKILAKRVGYGQRFTYTKTKSNCLTCFVGHPYEIPVDISQDNKRNYIGIKKWFHNKYAKHVLYMTIKKCNASVPVTH